MSRHFFRALDEGFQAYLPVHKDQRWFSENVLSRKKNFLSALCEDPICFFPLVLERKCIPAKLVFE